MKKAEPMEDFKTTLAQPLLLSIPDVATSLGLGRSKVYELIAQEGLPIIRFADRCASRLHPCKSGWSNARNSIFLGRDT